MAEKGRKRGREGAVTPLLAFPSPLAGVGGVRAWSKGLGILELSLYKFAKLRDAWGGVGAGITGVATPGSSNLELAETVSILQPNHCKIRVRRKKEKRGGEEGEEPLLGRVRKEDAPGRWGWWREPRVCEESRGLGVRASVMERRPG